MRHTWSIWAGLSFSFLTGCGAAPEAGAPGSPGSRGAPASSGAPRAGEQALSPAHHPSPDELGPGAWWEPPLSPDLLYPVPDLLAWTPTGDLAVVEGATGAVRQQLVTLELAGAHDLAYDEARQRAWIAESDDEGALGEIASYPVVAGTGGPTLGARAHEASLLSGEARLLSTPLGVVSFEDGGGGRWRLLGGGHASAPVPAAPPSSAWLTLGAGGPMVRGLAYGAVSGELDALAAAAQPGALAAATSAPLDVEAGTLPPCARVVAAPLRGGALMLDVSGSFLSVRAVKGAHTGAPALAPLGASGLRIEDAVGLRGGKLVAVLLSGTTEVVALEIDAQLHVASMARLQLPGHPAPSTLAMSHALAEQGYGRLVAATSAGVFSIQIQKDATGLHLGLAWGFEGGGLRGPVASLWTPD